jgi:hypothetical protein
MHRIRLAALTLLTACVGYGQARGYATIYTFKGGQDGASPNGVVLGKNGDLYGTTYTGGVNECGVNVYFWCGSVFQLTPAEGGTWTKTIIFSFNGTDGGLPSQTYESGPGPRPIFGPNGALYGTTENGGQYDSSSGAKGGTVWELMPPSVTGGAWTETVLYSFQNSLQAPNTPYGGLLLSSTGSVFGTTFSDAFGGFYQGGTAFELIPPAESGGNWTLNNLIDFETAGIGQSPDAGLTALGGSLYGTLGDIGSNCGSVYELSPPTSPGSAWSGKTIYGFLGAPGPCYPIAPLTVGPSGVLYGTTYEGGSGLACTFPPYLVSGCGAVFQLTPPATPGGAWTESVLYSFSGSGGDGAFPLAGVVLGKNGVLYGTTTYGGSATSGSPCNGYGATGCGTVFQLTPPAAADGPWTETILHSFTGQDGDGSIPGPLTLSPKGVLFGPAQRGGGTEGAGTIFALVP